MKFDFRHKFIGPAVVLGLNKDNKYKIITIKCVFVKGLLWNELSYPNFNYILWRRLHQVKRCDLRKNWTKIYMIIIIPKMFVSGVDITIQAKVFILPLTF